jgi:hypothetical protein
MSSFAYKEFRSHSRTCIHRNVFVVSNPWSRSIRYSETTCMGLFQSFVCLPFLLETAFNILFLRIEDQSSSQMKVTTPSRWHAFYKSPIIPLPSRRWRSPTLPAVTQTLWPRRTQTGVLLSNDSYLCQTSIFGTLHNKDRSSNAEGVEFYN